MQIHSKFFWIFSFPFKSWIINFSWGARGRNYSSLLFVCIITTLKGTLAQDFYVKQRLGVLNRDQILMQNHDFP